MLSSHSLILCLLMLVVPQGPQEKIRQHYEAAEAARLAGKLEAAEAEYAAILGEGYQRLGRIYLARSDYLPAITTFETAQRYRTDAPDLHLDLAIAYFGARQYEKAKLVSQKVISLGSDSAGARQMLGKSYFMLGDLDHAIAELETAAKLAPTDIDVAYTLGVSYLRNRQPEKAKQLYASLVRTYGDQPQLHVVIGRAYRQSGLLADAAEEFKRAIALDPRFPRAHYYLGLTYLLDEGQSKISEALEEFKLEVTANPDEFLANYYLGVVYNFQRQWELAVTSLQKAAGIQANNPDPYFQLGQAYQELGRHQEAIEALRKAIAFNPSLAHNKGQVTSAHHRLAQSLLKTGQTEAGQKELQIAAELKAEAFKLEQQNPNSISEPAGETPTVATVAPLDEKSQQDLQRSEDYYKKVVGTAHRNIGLLRGQRQLFQGAAEQFELAARWNPQQEGLDYNLGLAYYKSQDFKHATTPLEREIKSHPENRAAVMLLGLTYFKLGDYIRAAELLSGVVDAQTTDLDARYSLASSLILAGKDIERGRNLLVEVIQVRPDHAEAHLLLGKTLLKQGDKPSAIASLEQAIKLKPEWPDAHYELGQAYIAAGRKADGKKELDLAKQLRSLLQKQ